jgi:hypothetical protein
MEVSGQLDFPAPLSPKPLGQEAGWAPEPVWTRGGNGIPELGGSSSSAEKPRDCQTDIKRKLLHCRLENLFLHISSLGTIVTASYGLLKMKRSENE